MLSNSYVESIERQLAKPRRASPSRQLPRPPSLHWLSTLLPPFRQLIYISRQTAPAKAFLNLPTLLLLVFHECWLEMIMDSSAVGNLIDMMMMSSSNSSSSGCENDAAASAAAAVAAVAGEKKRRFSEAQVKSLEVMFEEQAKLEPRKKQQLAKELGLQPRQVAIWFQNKRARWKSKQLERAYAALSADYDALRSSFDTLLHQKNVLSVQVQRLAEMLDSNNQREKKESSKQIDFTVTRSEADQTQILSLSSNKNNCDVERKVSHLSVGKEVEHHVHKTKEQAGGGRILVSDDGTEQKQFCFHSTGWPSDQLMSGGGCSQWWEFLSYE
ncbi:hypothetical protein IEQ34_020024 [Dendrobium chrysotoxum]|uniref:Homeobox-leucine zipper protein n=1 Tax=Dendrobium chrysotoxum TaxID=161865 RepID=A0AAV7G970_DENCH|nr:hypothetical protein IEQ34_020024 [Dendrobium chrysotoxum]